MGSLGIITKMGIKLYPWPGPPVWPTEGVQPEKKAVLPPERFTSYFMIFPTLEQAVDAIREMAKAEIGAWVIQFDAWDWLVWGTRSREEYYEQMESEFWRTQPQRGHTLGIGIWGFASEKQVKYEEKVLKAILQELGGEFLPEEWSQWLRERVAPNVARDTHRGGRFLRVPVGVIHMECDSLADAIRGYRRCRQIRDKFTPPFGEIGLQSKIKPFDFGHVVEMEVDFVSEKSAECVRLVAEGVWPEVDKMVREESIIGSRCELKIAQYGECFSNIHHLLAGIKKKLDPNNLSNPTRLIDMEIMDRIERGEAVEFAPDGTFM
jgi:hypothetical protein